MKILAVGDIHLGRTPSRLPAELAGRSRRYGPAAAWERTVAAAMQAKVQAVLLAGDVVDREDDFFEAYRETGAGRRTTCRGGYQRDRRRRQPRRQGIAEAGQGDSCVQAVGRRRPVGALRDRRWRRIHHRLGLVLSPEPRVAESPAGHTLQAPGRSEPGPSAL